MPQKYDIKEILKVGDQLFRKNGYTKTGTDEILTTSKFPRSSFYYHFKNKQGFAIKTLQFYSQNNRSYLKNILLEHAENSALERLKQYFFQIVHMSNERAYETCCLVHQFSIEESGVEGPIQEVAKKEFQSWVDIVSQCIRQGQANGEITQEYEAEELAHYLFSLLYGMFTFTRLSRDGNKFIRLMEMGFNLISK